jgi:hypothetical protein
MPSELKHRIAALGGFRIGETVFRGGHSAFLISDRLTRYKSCFSPLDPGPKHESNSARERRSANSYLSTGDFTSIKTA